MTGDEVTGVNRGGDDWNVALSTTGVNHGWALELKSATGVVVVVVVVVVVRC